MSTKEVSIEEVEKHNSKESIWLIINDRDDGGIPKVYDVTKYLDDHPGGAEVLLESAGQDATNMFEDIGHTNDARTEMKRFFVGLLQLTEAEKLALEAKALAKEAAKKAAKGKGLSPVAVAVMAIAIGAGYYYSQQ